MMNRTREKIVKYELLIAENKMKFVTCVYNDFLVDLDSEDFFDALGASGLFLEHPNYLGAIYFNDETICNIRKVDGRTEQRAVYLFECRLRDPGNEVDRMIARRIKDCMGRHII